jgi:hypothetical protein
MTRALLCPVSATLLTKVISDFLNFSNKCPFCPKMKFFFKNEIFSHILRVGDKKYIFKPTLKFFAKSHFLLQRIAFLQKRSSVALSAPENFSKK